MEKVAAMKNAIKNTKTIPAPKLVLKLLAVMEKRPAMTALQIKSYSLEMN